VSEPLRCIEHRRFLRENKVSNTCANSQRKRNTKLKVQRRFEKIQTATNVISLQKTEENSTMKESDVQRASEERVPFILVERFLTYMIIKKCQNATRDKKRERANNSKGNTNCIHYAPETSTRELEPKS